MKLKVSKIDVLQSMLVIGVALVGVHWLQNYSPNNQQTIVDAAQVYDLEEPVNQPLDNLPTPTIDKSSDDTNDEEVLAAVNNQASAQQPAPTVSQELDDEPDPEDQPTIVPAPEPTEEEPKDEDDDKEDDKDEDEIDIDWDDKRWQCYNRYYKKPWCHIFFDQPTLD